MEDMVRILIADDHHLFRQGLAHILNDAPGCQVVGGASSVADAIRMAQELHADVVVMDLWLPEMAGLQAIRELSAETPPVKVIVLTLSDPEVHLFTALQAGARGFLLKNVTSNELVEAIRQVQEGGVALDPHWTARLVEEYRRLAQAALNFARERLGEQPDGENLTEREREVLGWVVQGLSNREIGARLGLSPYTVKAHMHSILDKLAVHRRSEAAVWAVGHGFASPPPKNDLSSSRMD